MIINGYSIYQLMAKLADDMILSMGIYTGKAVNSIIMRMLEFQKDFMHQKKLRGFETGQVGPKDGKDYVGGNYVQH